MTFTVGATIPKIFIIDLYLIAYLPDTLLKLPIAVPTVMTFIAENDVPTLAICSSDFHYRE